jgi:hypothetical protein
MSFISFFFRSLLFSLVCSGCLHQRSFKKLPSLEKQRLWFNALSSQIEEQPLETNEEPAESDGVEGSSQLLEKIEEVNKEKVSQKKDDLDVYCYAYSQSDCETFFGANLLLYGYQPIQVHIVNNTSQSAFIRPGYIDREIYPSYKIFPFIKFDTALFVYYAGLPSLLFYWPLVPLVVFPVGYWLSQKNADYEHLLRSHTIEEGDTVEIRPFTSLDKLVFVSTSLPRSVTIQLYHQTDGALRSF